MESLPVYYYDYPNVGDQLSVLLLDKLFHQPAQAAPYTTADVVAVGSILDAFLDNTILPRRLVEMRPLVERDRPIHVWGTGIMRQYEDPLPPLRSFCIHALRGPLTKRIVEASLGTSLSCPLADPGLLASLLVEKPLEKKHRVGIVPHYVEKQEPLWEEVRAFYGDAVIIDVQEDPLAVIRQIGACELVLSSSLHGLIIADSFGIPNRWCLLTDKILGDGFKYRDYYQSFGMDAAPLILPQRAWPSLDEIRQDYRIPFSAVLEKQNSLISAGKTMLRAFG